MASSLPRWLLYGVRRELPRMPGIDEKLYPILLTPHFVLTSGCFPEVLPKAHPDPKRGHLELGRPWLCRGK